MFAHVERGFYVVVAGALALGGAILFGYVAFRFARELGRDIEPAILGFLEGMLLVFIITELLHTVRGVIHRDVLMTKPFLVVGIVAAIRRLVVITAEAQEEATGEQFTNLMIEMGILGALVLILGGTIALLRRSEAEDGGEARGTSTSTASN